MSDLVTKHAPAEKLLLEEVEKESKMILSTDFFETFLNDLTEIALILNEQRQIIFSNKQLLEMLEISNLDKILGDRPGEVLNCVNSIKSDGGCGTSEYCKYCNIVNLILESQKKKEKLVTEARISVRRGDKIVSLDLFLSSSRIYIEGKLFTFLVISDISDKKRKEALEKIFYHDIVNKAGNVQGMLNLIKMEINDSNIESDELVELVELVDLAELSSKEFVDDILAQRDLALAEKNELQVTSVELNSIEFLEYTIATNKRQEVAEGKNIIISKDIENFNFKSDKILLGRVMGNLIKNALEASKKGMTVTVGSKLDAGDVVFYVHNETYMPEEVQFQMFQRSFSSKGKNRGLGSYSVKLLTERYLKGSVFFTTDLICGTVFTIKFSLIGG